MTRDELIVAFGRDRGLCKPGECPDCDTKYECFDKGIDAGIMMAGYQLGKGWKRDAESGTVEQEPKLPPTCPTCDGPRSNMHCSDGFHVVELEPLEDRSKLPYCPGCYTNGHEHRKTCRYVNCGMQYHVRPK